MRIKELLEDKKKELELLSKSISRNNIEYIRRLNSEIAILEQAIAEMQKQKELERSIGFSFGCVEGKIEAMKEELYFHTHLFDNKECPDGQIADMALMISAVSPYAKLINSRIEYLKKQLNQPKTE